MPALIASVLRSRRAPRAGAALGLRDPAPSRVAYRLHRLWLTPIYRKALRIGLPSVLILATGLIYIGDEGRRAALAQTAADLRLSIENRPEFMVKMIAIDGASGPVADAVRGMLPVKLPESSFRLDLPAMRALIEQLDAVARADLFVRPGGVLQVTIHEREPVVLWRGEQGLQMLDATGHRVATLLDRAARPDLPLIAGAGGDDHVGEALKIFAAAAPVLPRVRGLIYTGDRRWDVVLDRDQRILLPQDNPLAAMGRLMALQRAEDILGRDVAVVDMRNEERLTIRLGAEAMAERRRMMDSETRVSH